MVHRIMGSPLKNGKVVIIMVTLCRWSRKSLSLYEWWDQMTKALAMQWNQQRDLLATKPVRIVEAYNM
jgi:hypothetical protein